MEGARKDYEYSDTCFNFFLAFLAFTTNLLDWRWCSPFMVSGTPLVVSSGRHWVASLS